MSKRTGFIWHEAYAWYQLGNEAGIARPDGRGVQPDRHAYDPETVRRFRNLVEMSGLADQLVCMKPTPAAESDLLRVHTREHVEQIRALSAQVTGGDGTGRLSNWGACGTCIKPNKTRATCTSLCLLARARASMSCSDCWRVVVCSAAKTGEVNIKPIKTLLRTTTSAQSASAMARSEATALLTLKLSAVCSMCCWRC